MIVLKIFSKIFSTTRSLTRKEMESYLSDGSHSGNSEQTPVMHDFDLNAMEGWHEIGLPISSMSSLDEKFNNRFKTPNNTIYKWTFLTIGFILIGSSFIYFLSTKESKNETNELVEKQAIDASFSTPQIIEKTDIETITDMNQFVEIPKSFQLLPKDLIEKNKIENKLIPQIQLDSLKNDHTDNIERIPTIINESIETINDSELNKLILTFGNELFLHDLKVVDYRSIRKGEIETERMRYSGTPANFADYEKNSIELDNDWETVKVPYMEYLAITMNFIVNEKYKKALPRINLILEKYPNDVNANFYGGLIHFNLGNYQSAITFFEKSFTMDLGNFYEEAKWFKSLSLEHLNEIQKAQQIWIEIIEHNGFYAVQAKNKMDK